jgi:hypothetical protein
VDNIRERDELLAAGVAQLPAKDYRHVLLAAAENTIATKSKEVEDLLAVIGDPETVCDEGGWPPAERREMALIRFKSERGSQVRTLRTQIADATTTLKSLKGQAERAELRESIRRNQAHLAHWEQMRPLQAADMCSECGKLATARRSSARNRSAGQRSSRTCLGRLLSSFSTASRCPGEWESQK